MKEHASAQPNVPFHSSMCVCVCLNEPKYLCLCSLTAINSFAIFIVKFIFRSYQPLAIKMKCSINSVDVCIKIERKMLETIIQIVSKFMLEIRPKCWSLQPN